MEKEKIHCIAIILRERVKGARRLGNAFFINIICLMTNKKIVIFIYKSVLAFKYIKIHT